MFVFVAEGAKTCCRPTVDSRWCGKDFVISDGLLMRVASSGDCLVGKGENYQVCSVQYCVQQLCTVQCTNIVGGVV